MIFGWPCEKMCPLRHHFLSKATTSFSYSTNDFVVKAKPIGLNELVQAALQFTKVTSVQAES